MSAELNELLALEPTEFTEVLNAMILKMDQFYRSVQQIAEKKTKKLTTADIKNIPEHLVKAHEFKGLVSILRDTATLKYDKMSNYQIKKVDGVLTEMAVKEIKLDLVIKRFLDLNAQRESGKLL